MHAYLRRTARVNLRGRGSSQQALIGFKLNRFSSAVSKWVRNKRAGIINNITRQFFAWKSSPSTSFGQSFAQDPSYSWSNAGA